MTMDAPTKDVAYLARTPMNAKSLVQEIARNLAQGPIGKAVAYTTNAKKRDASARMMPRPTIFSKNLARVREAAVCCCSYDCLSSLRNPVRI